MSIKLGINTASLSAQRQFAKHSDSLEGNLTRIGSGMRINSAADDAAGLAIASKLRLESRVYNQALRNLNDGLSMTSVAESALEQMQVITHRHRELAEQAANGSYSATQRAALNMEARSLTEEYNRIVQSSSFNGRSVFGEPTSSTAIQAGYGSSNSLSVQLGEELARGTAQDGGVSAGSGIVLLSSAVSGTSFARQTIAFRVDGVAAGFGGTVVSLGQTAQQEVFDLYLSDGSNWVSNSEPPRLFLYAPNVDGGNQRQFMVQYGNSAYIFDGPSVDITIPLSKTADELAVDTVAAIQSFGYFTAENLGGGHVRVTANSNGSTTSSAYITDESMTSSVVNTQSGVWDVNDTSQVTLAVRSAINSTLFSASTVTNGSFTVSDRTLGTNANAYTIGNAGTLETVTEGVGLSTYFGQSSILFSGFGDINGDGALDVLSLGGVNLGNGDGTFKRVQSFIAFPTLSGLNKMAVGNINGGSADIVSFASTTAVGVMIGNGNGTFKATTTYLTSGGFTVRDVEVKDINGDTFDDLVTFEESGTSGRIQIRLANGSGGFSAGTTLGGAFNAASTAQFELLDMNNDGSLDIVMNETGSMTVRLGNGNGTFLAKTTYTTAGTVGAFALEDINGDSYRDMVYRHGGLLSYRMNSGSGTFGAAVSLTFAGGSPTGFSLGNLNGDSSPDIIVHTNNSRTYMFMNPGDGAYSARITHFIGATLGHNLIDINKDGLDDYILTDTTSSRVYLSNGDGTLKAPISVRANSQYQSEVDLNNDGTTDLFSGYSSNFSVRLSSSEATNDVAEQFRITFGADIAAHATISHIDLSSATAARLSLDDLDQRLNKIAAEFGKIGAMTSRFQSVVSTVASKRENIQAAESRIVDVNMADESAAMMKTQIALNVSQAILGQANLAPQLALSLIKGIT